MIFWDLPKNHDNPHVNNQSATHSISYVLLHVMISLLEVGNVNHHMPEAVGSGINNRTSRAKKANS